MTSNNTGAFVWIWLKDQSEPVIAGRIEEHNGKLAFNYGQSYLKRKNAIPIYDPELPLKAGRIPLLDRMIMPSCIRDGSPDAWGRRVIINQVTGKKKEAIDLTELDELAYLLLSGSDRIGALDFQASATAYNPRTPRSATLEELQRASELVDTGVPLTKELDQALNHGSSIGGARPKASIESNEKKYIAKFSGSSDTYSVVKAEYVAMKMAKKVGINVADVELTQALGKDVLLIERFDRYHNNEKKWCRKAMVSGLTILGISEDEARYASYEDLAEKIRFKFTNPKNTLEELYKRMVFNILVGNTDDHARNHAAFWDGEQLTLTPAYDICPQNRTGGEASQAMNISGSNKLSRLASCLTAAPSFLISESRAKEIIKFLVTNIKEFYPEICQEGKLSEIDQKFFWRRQFLNPYCFYGLPEDFENALTSIL
ncbi:type II toxin-antitoxin system HipA family toxin [uncultured Amphritea sp.]|uniref:type II toxin-antitoxin system HipA family toxin n=1 Tax=uncultured Amphritea sp. TaxID=981605 RepID=UPI00263356B3|nr:type II toxin-antitoxin system HipA family toxin [uncultured Amphritea sp.]